jgi:hypothetical protein
MNQRVYDETLQACMAGGMTDDAAHEYATDRATRKERSTPLTEAQSVDHIGFYSCATVPSDFARKLERDRAELLEALKECITSEGAACFSDIQNHPEWMQRRLYKISDLARAAIAKATGEQP